MWFCHRPSAYGCRVGKSLIGSGVPANDVTCAVCQEALGDAALVEHFDRPRVQPARAGAGEVAVRAPLDDRDVDARQRQLGGQHQPGRTAAGDRHGMLGHVHPQPRFLGFSACGGALCSTTRGLLQAPLPDINWERRGR